MTIAIKLFFLLPLLGFFLTLLTRSTKEKIVSGISFYTTAINLLFTLIVVIYWISSGAEPVNLKEITLYNTPDFQFYIDFIFDRVSATYLLAGNIICFMVVVFSRYYMHRESGFKRFFNTVLFFNTGYNITILSGNFETLFIGWEFLGISSFLLIAFYRLRYLPVKNAIKVFTIYRIGDVGILLATWMSHHLWHENITFYTLQDFDLVQFQIHEHGSLGIVLSLLILLAALAKSAQFPFSAWLPRAMEGPTPSSAIFYGSLSVHIGVFLLMRTFQFWEHQITVRWIIAGFGLLTAVLCTMIANVQSTIKSQIAYSSSAQIGIMFMEVAAGLEVLALIHFVGNAFLRTYQLLVSPSVVAYHIREQFYHYEEPEYHKYTNGGLKNRIKNAAYLLSLKEWHLDSLIFQIFFRPLKKIRLLLGFINISTVFLFLIPLYMILFYQVYINSSIPPEWHHNMSIAFGVLALMLVSKAYNERSSARLSWALVVFGHFFIDLAVSLNDELSIEETMIYLSGILVSGILGYACLLKVRKLEKHNLGLSSFHGLVTKYKVLAFLFLVASLGLAGFPITPSFLGEDLILSHINQNQITLAALVSVIFIINGITVIRIYARVFLGRNIRNFQNTPDLTA